MASAYIFVFYEEDDPTYRPSLTASNRLNGRVAYMDHAFDLTMDITGMAVSQFETGDEDPIIALSFSSQKTHKTFYCPLEDLSNAIASNHEDGLWRLLVQTTRKLAVKHRVQ